MTMRILHVVGGLNRGGAETWLVELLHHIDRQTYPMDFLVHTTGPGAYDDEVRALGSHIIPCVKPSNPLEYAYNFQRILREFGPYECVHCHIHQSSGYVLALAAILGVPIRIAHSHIDTRFLDSRAAWPRKAYIAVMDFLLSHSATAAIAVSESAATSLFSGHSKTDPPHLCPLGIDLRPFVQEFNRDALRTQLGIARDAFVIGHVGRFCRQKNHRFLVDIAETLCNVEPRAVFLLVGDGPLRPEIEGLVRSRGLQQHFVFAGTRTDVPALMKAVLDCFVFPSLYEGLGLVLWEAQAAGLPCLAADAIPGEATAVPHLVRRLSLGEPAQAWAQALIEITHAGSAPRAGIPAEMLRHSIEASAASLESIYRSAASHGPALLVNA
jgi:glycosyltransferase involved in cell wall biosynthesis